ncbi:MAG: hypothetical protein ACREDF_02550 [Thermoplasmata archaeon]
MTASAHPRMAIEISIDGEHAWNELSLPFDPDTPFSVVPYDVLKRVGIQPQSLEEVRIAGKIEDRNVGTAYFRYKERVSQSRVVFPHPEDPCTWGWHAVYYLGWEIDPADGELRKVARILGPE